MGWENGIKIFFETSPKYNELRSESFESLFKMAIKIRNKDNKN